MAALTKSVVCLLVMVAVVCAYPFESPSINLENLSPDELAFLLEHMELQQPQPVVMGPVEIPPTQFSTAGQDLGSVTSVDVDSNGDLYVFHRADRPWTEETFEYGLNILTEHAKAPIEKETIFKLNPDTGKIISKFGGSIFNVPHGLTIDKDDNIWVTDVGRHQILRFSNGSTTPDLELGEKFVPGNDDAHFCKPTDVAVASNGEFFVTDGYCNSRVMKFSKDGKLIAKWGTPIDYETPVTPYHMDIPHSLTLIEDLDLVCVADRENQRSTCFNAGLGSGRKLGMYNRTIIGHGEMGKVFAVYYNKADQTLVAAGEIADGPYLDEFELTYPPRAMTYSLSGEMLAAWAPITPVTVESGPSLIHDICVSKDGKDFFLADVYQQKVLKYTKPREAQQA